MPEQGFETEQRQGNGQSYLKLKDGDKAIIRLLAVPTKYRQHWLKGESRSALCSKREHGECAICDSPQYTREERQFKTRFTVPVYVHAVSVKLNAQGKPVFDEVSEVKVWDGSQTVLASLGEAVSEVDDNWQANDFTVARKGGGFNDTTYTVLPRKTSKAVPGDIEVPDLMKQMSDRIADAAAGPGPSLDEALSPGGFEVHASIPDNYGDPFAEDEE